LRIPIQLTPNVDKPEISIETVWKGASPVEVEREVTDVQEEQLKNLDGLEEMTSESVDGRSNISLLFEIGTEIDTALLRTSNKMEQVKQYPLDADKPLIKSGGRRETAIAWMILRARPGYTGTLYYEYDFLDEHVKPALERIAGIASANIYGGRERELQVIFDVDALTARQVTVPELIRALDIENKNISAGDFDEGKRRYIARTVGEFERPEDVENVIIKRVGGIPVSVKDVAVVRLGFSDPRVVVRHVGTPTMVMNAVREPGANVLVVMEKLKETLKGLNEGILKDHGIEIEQVYDETGYIYSAIDLVKKNILVGGTLAVVVLLAFLAQYRQHRHHRGRHPGEHCRHLSGDDPHGAQHQRGEPGRPEFRHRHGGGQLHRGLREHLPAPGDGQKPRQGGLRRHQRSLGSGPWPAP
jgi:HAE1 family hydrophobic/amphiphilic exporter-1